MGLFDDSQELNRVRGAQSLREISEVFSVCMNPLSFISLPSYPQLGQVCARGIRGAGGRTGVARANCLLRILDLGQSTSRAGILS